MLLSGNRLIRQGMMQREGWSEGKGGDPVSAAPCAHPIGGFVIGGALLVPQFMGPQTHFPHRERWLTKLFAFGQALKFVKVVPSV